MRDLQKNIRKCVDAAQKEHVIVTRHGHPAAIVVGVEGRDWEDIVYQTSPAFWRMIEERRKGKTISLADMRKRLEKRWARKKGK
jgi:prevent-host-death family protein